MSDPNEILANLGEAIDKIDQPAFVLLAIGKDGEAFCSMNDAMGAIPPNERAEIYCGSSLCLLSSILEPEQLNDQ